MGQGHIVYKEKEPNLLWLQFVAATSTLRYVTGQGCDLSDRRRRHSQSQSLSKRNFSFHRSTVLVVPPQQQQQRSSTSRLGTLGSSSLNDEPSMTTDYSTPLDAASAKATSVPPSLPSRRKQSSLPSLEPTMEAAAPADDIKYDADGYIIRRESTLGFDNYHHTGDGSDGGSEVVEHALAVDPIVIKPAEEAVEASHEELSRAMLHLSRPPPSSNAKSKKGAAAASAGTAVKSERRKKKGGAKKKKKAPKERARKPVDLAPEQQHVEGEKEKEKKDESLGAENLTRSGVNAITAPDSAPVLPNLRSSAVPAAAAPASEKGTASSAPTVPAATAEAEAAAEAEAETERRRRSAVSTHLVVNEVLNCVLGGGGELQELAAVGTVSLMLSPAPEQEFVVPFELDNTERIAELVVNDSFVSETSESVFEVRAPAGVGSVSALRYSISLSEPQQQQQEAPLSAEVTCDASSNSVRLKLRPCAWLPPPSSVSILLGLDGDVDALLSSTAGCMFDAANRRLCWKAVPMQNEFEAHLSGGGGGQLRVVSCLLQFSCAHATLSGIEAFIDPDPVQRYVCTATQRQLCSRPFKAF